MRPEEHGICSGRGPGREAPFACRMPICSANPGAQGLDLCVPQACPVTMGKSFPFLGLSFLSCHTEIL